MRRDWDFFIYVAIGVGVFVYAAIAWCLIRYRRRPGRQSARFDKNTPLEFFYFLTPLAIVIVLFIVTLHFEMPVDDVAAAPQARVAVTAFRWSWEFQYPGTRIATVGTPDRPPTLYLPVDRTTEIDLTSIDVTHSFWVPAFLFKRDAIPGMTNRFDLTPTRIGTFPGRCAQFCGLDHALMTFDVRVVSPQSYARFLASNGAVTP